MSIMTKRKAHFQAFGYEPLRMKPAHFASGFFIALTGKVFTNELLNKVAVIRTNKGLLQGYTPEDVYTQLRTEELISLEVTQSDVELLRVQINGVVNNDDAMYAAFRPYRPKGNDYTFISPRLLTTENRTDGFAGYFVKTILGETDSGRDVLKAGQALVAQPQGALEQLIEPLLEDENPELLDLQERYESTLGELDQARISDIAATMQSETVALQRLCDSLQGYGHYKKIRYFVLGLLAWLMRYLLKTSSHPKSEAPLMFFDFVGEKYGRVRAQSQACYARLRETVRRSYSEFAAAGRFDSDPIAEGLFSRQTEIEDTDFRFLEDHFNDFALRMGYVQPRTSRVQQKHFEIQHDTLRVLMLSILDSDASITITLDEVCKRLCETWGVMTGALGDDLEALRRQDYFGFDEEDLRQNSDAFSQELKNLNMAFEPSDGLVLCSTDIGEAL